jgi:peptidoglycan/xylan/chitin deacetylase (PgdA/CDA1 family)
MTDICLTVDLEPDCPPYLEGWRGMEEGAPRLLNLLEEEGTKATFFATGEAGERFPAFIESLLAKGHELGCHGQTHRSFCDLDREEAERELDQSTQILREHGSVTAFRAPYLRFPEEYLPLLEDRGFRNDASRSRYKPIHWGPRSPSGLHRILASTTPSFLRLPPWFRDPFLAKMEAPVVLFVHPWEFVEMKGEPIPWDSRLGTGEHALKSLKGVLAFFQERNARFRKISELSGNPV